MNLVSLTQRLLILLFTGFLLTSNLQVTTFAQAKGVEVASVYDLPETDLQDGDVMSTSEKGIVRATSMYDTHLFGVVQKDPLMVYRDAEKTATPVLRNGTAQVRVSSLNGPIKNGDYITSSEIRGIGAKAIQSGYVLGTALTSFDGNNSQQTDYKGKKVAIGTITIALRIEYAEITNARNTSRLANTINDALLRNLQTPERFTEIFRYLFALLILFLSLAVAYLANSRSTARSIEAIGRNPIAKNEIKASARMSFFFSLMIVVAGIVAALVIILV